LLRVAGLLAAFVALPAAAQTTLSGLVTDTDGQPLPGATVRLAGTSSGAATNAAGRYSFVATGSGGATLVASFVGYETASREVTLAGGAQTQDFRLGLDALSFGEVVVTGVVNPTTKIESATSITTLAPAAIQATAPRTTAEIFRAVPGIRSEASGGDGNTNITVRGVPISAGGSRYLQLQEDGLPVLLFGDIAFATSDIFVRPDASLARLEAVRGGAASVLASNSPAGIINFISRTGEVAGGSIATSAGLDHDSRRVDFEYGAPISEDLSFHVGGFYRVGSGIRHSGYLAENGGQFRANLTRRFDAGYARVYLKLLDDRTPAYMPMPVQVSGTNADPTWESVPGFSATLGAPHSPFFLQNNGPGAEGQNRLSDLADGMRPVSRSIGAEFLFDVAGFTVQNRGRVSLNSGRFVAPFPAAVGPTAAIVAGAGTAVGQDFSGATLTYADNGAPFTGELLQSIVLFDTELRNFDTFFNDASVSYAVPDAANVTFTAGLFTGVQRINMAWLWNSYLLEVAGEDARLVDVTLPGGGGGDGGTLWSRDGLFAYGAAPFGNCCAVAFNSTYRVTAPYATVSAQPTPAVTVDAGVRFDLGAVRGVGSGGIVGAIDVNGDGTIDPIEQAVNRIDTAQRNPVHYDYSYPSVTAGVNYLLTPRSAVFVRGSRGASAQADRVIFPSGTYVADADGNVPFGKVNSLTQAELGFKQQIPNGAVFLTGFFAATNEAAGFEATTQEVIENDFTALGAELEATYAVQGVDVRGALTFTQASISSADAAIDGNRPRRQPLLAFSLVPTYRRGPLGVGLSVLGQTGAYAQNTNELWMPGYAILNAFADVTLTPGLTLGISANNLLDATGFTESEEGAITEGQVNYLRARSVTGRSLVARLGYTF